MENQNENSRLVSVVICTYNRKDYLADCIESVLNQQRNFPIEILIGDDVSTDGTREMLLDYQKKYPEIVFPILHTMNLGIGKNWATVMKQVRGKYVALCDDDDYWHNTEKLQKQVDILEANAHIGLVHTDYRTLDINSGKILEKKVQNASEQNLLQKLFKGQYFLLTSSCVFRNELIQKYVSLNDYIKYNFPIQDWNTWMLIANYTEFFHMPVSTVTYRISSDSMSRPKDFEKIEKKYAKEKVMYKYLCDKFPEDLHYDETEYDVYVNGILLGLAYKKMDYRNAHKYGSVMKSQGSNSLKVRCTQNRIPFYAFWLLQKLKSLITNR
jgi:glucosyltransferase